MFIFQSQVYRRTNSDFNSMNPMSDIGFFRVDDKRGRFDDYSVSVGEGNIKIHDNPLLWPLRNPSGLGQRIKGFDDDPEARVVFTAYCGGSNCISYGFRNIIPKLELVKKNKEPVEWYDTLILPSDVKTIDYLLNTNAT